MNERARKVGRWLMCQIINRNENETIYIIAYIKDLKVNVNRFAGQIWLTQTPPLTTPLSSIFSLQ